MRTQREYDILKEEQRAHLAEVKENVLKEYLGPRYVLMPPPPPGMPKPIEPEPEDEEY